MWLVAHRSVNLSSVASAALPLSSRVRGRRHGWSTRARLRVLPVPRNSSVQGGRPGGTSPVAASGCPWDPPETRIPGSYGLNMPDSHTKTLAVVRRCKKVGPWKVTGSPGGLRTGDPREPLHHTRTQGASSSPRTVKNECPWSETLVCGVCHSGLGARHRLLGCDPVCTAAGHSRRAGRGTALGKTLGLTSCASGS